MRRLILVLTLNSIVFYGSIAQSLTAMTYNIRYDTPRDGENQWAKRKAFLVNQVKFYHPDVLGIQEGLNHQVAYLDSSLESYRYVGVGRDDGAEKGEYTAIFYDTREVELLEQNTFWLSETPGKVSVGWDAALERICTYALFRTRKPKRKFWVFNTHFDHIGEEARSQSVRLIVKKIKEINTKHYPVVLMGDLNLTPDRETIQFLTENMKDTRNSSTEVSFGPDATFNNFKFKNKPERRIDYIFTSITGIKTKRYAVLTDSKELKYPSDHFAVFAELELLKTKRKK